MSWSAVKDVGAPSTTRAGTPLTVKKTFPRATSTVINAAIVATYHRTQHRPESWADCLVTLSRQIPWLSTLPILSETTLKGSKPGRRANTRRLAPSKQISKHISLKQDLHWHKTPDYHTEHVLDTKKSPTISSFEIARTTRSFVFVVASLP